MTDRPSARMKQRLNIWLSLPVALIGFLLVLCNLLLLGVENPKE